jgi:hypothetical protein
MRRSAVFLSIFIGGAILLMLCYITIPVALLAHGGGLDSYGCHRHTNTPGNYHCHRGSCAGKTFVSQDAMLKSVCRK